MRVTDAIQTARYRLETQGLEKGRAELQGVDAATRKAADGAAVFERQVTAAEKSVPRLEARIKAMAAAGDESYKILTKIQRGEALLSAGRDKGVAIPDAAVNAVAALKQRYAELTGETDRNSVAVGLNRVQQMELMHVGRAMVDMLAAGQSPMRALEIEGARIVEIFGMGPAGVGGTFRALGALVAPFLPLLAAAAAGLAAFRVVASAYEDLKAVNEGAEKAGVSTTLFQVWTGQAAKLRLTVDEARASIEQAGAALRKQIDTGSMLKADDGASIVERAQQIADIRGADPASKRMAENARTVEQMHNAAIQLVDDYLKAATAFDSIGREVDAVEAKMQAVAFATETWGDAGRKIVEALETGSAKAADLYDYSDKIANRWSNEILTAQKEAAQALAEAREELSQSVTNSEALALATIRVENAWARVLGLLRQAVGLVDRIVSAAQRAPGHVGAVAGSAIAAYQKEQHGFGRLVQISPGEGSDNFTEFDLLQGAHQAVLRGDVKRPEDLPEPKTPRAHHARAHHPRAAREKTDEVERLLTSMEKENAILEAEAAAQGKSNVEKEKAIALARAEEAAKARGAKLTEEETRKIGEKAEHHALLKQRIDEVARAEAQMHEVSKFFGSTIESALEKAIIDGKRFEDVLRGVVVELERAALKALLLGEGPLAGLFGMGGGGMFGMLGGMAGGAGGGGWLLDFLSGGSFFTKGLSGFDKGGMITLDHLPRYAGGGGVAPDGGFPILAHPGEIVLNAAQQRNVAGAMRGDGLHLTLRPSYVFNNADPSTERRLTAQIHASHESLKRQIPAILQDAQARRP